MNFSVKYSSLALKSLRVCKNVVAMRKSFGNLVLVFKLMNLGNISSIYKRFEPIHRDTAPCIST